MPRALIIGCGNIAGLYSSKPADSKNFITHLQCYKDQSMEFELACFDTSQSRLDSFCDMFNIKNRSTDLEDVLDTFKPDIVSICNPDKFHYQTLSICLDKGIKKLWCEKPLTLNYSQAIEIQTKANENEAKILVNYFRRYSPKLNHLKSIVNSNTLGSLSRIVINASKGIGSNGCHALDLMMFLFSQSEVQLTNIVPLSLDKKMEFDLNGSFYCKWNNTPLFYSSNPGEEFNLFEIDFLFSKGRVISSNNAMIFDIFQNQPNPDFENAQILKAKEQLHLDWGNSMLEQLKSFFKECDSKNFNLNYLIPAVKNTKLVEQIFNSFAQNGEQLD